MLSGLIKTSLVVNRQDEVLGKVVILEVVLGAGVFSSLPMKSCGTSSLSMHVPALSMARPQMIHLRSCWFAAKMKGKSKPDNHGDLLI